MKLDPQIIQIIDQWGDYVLPTSNLNLDLAQDIIHDIQDCDTSIKISQISTKIYPVSSKLSNSLFILSQQVFKDYVQDHVSIALGVLSRPEFSLMCDIYKSGLIRNRKDFHYLLAHLPFYWKVLDLLSLLGNRTGNFLTSQVMFKSFMFPSIQSWILEHCTHLTQYTATLSKGQQVNLNLIYQASDQSLIPQIISDIISIFSSLLVIYDRPNPIPRLNLTYILTPFTKKINNFKPNLAIDKFLIKNLRHNLNLKYNFEKFTNPISSLSVNSGMTTTLGSHTYGESIVIWRKEEFNKVLIHELIHYYQLERGDTFISQGWNVSNNYPPQSRELFTEMQTWYFYTLWNLSKIKNLSKKDINFIFKYEQIYSLVNLVKIFKHYGLTSLDQFMTQNNPSVMINANCSVLYYYILKGILLYLPQSQYLVPTAYIQISKASKAQVIELVKSQLLKNLRDPRLQVLLDQLRQLNWSNSLRMMGIYESWES